MCSVQSNSENVELEWLVTFPGQDTIIMILYTNDSERNAVDYLPMNLTARLTQYRMDEGVESEIVLTVLRNVSMNGTIVECMSEDLASEVEIVYVNTSGIVMFISLFGLESYTLCVSASHTFWVQH